MVIVENFWQGKRVLVTGCSGLMGGPLCKMLLAAGAEPVGYDIDPTGTLKQHGIEGMFPIHRKSLSRMIVRDFRGVDVVFHLAAMSNVTRCRNNPWRAFTTNVQGTVQVLEMTRIANVTGPIVVASSNHVYGKQDRLPVSEDADLHQLDTYSTSKIAGDYIARAYAHNYGLNTVIIRNTNCFGPVDPHSDHIVPGTIISLLKGHPPVIKSDGRRKKAYLYVDDVMCAYMLIAEWAAGANKPGSVFNVADTPISVIELVDTIISTMWDMGLTGYGTGDKVVLGEPNDQTDEWLDTIKVLLATGWVPKVPLREAISLTVEGMRAQFPALDGRPLGMGVAPGDYIGG